MQLIAAHAASTEAWHAPLVRRAELSARVMRRIAGIVCTGLLEQLQNRGGLDDETRAFLRRHMQTRLKEIPQEDASSAAEFTYAEVMRRQANGCLDDKFVVEAARSGWRDAVEVSLAVLAGIDRAEVARILSTRNGWPTVALCWSAGLGMRTAYEIQLNVVGLPPAEVIAARNGIDFPLIPREMNGLMAAMGITCLP